MNEEKVTRETTETWRWTDWGEEFADCVVARPPGNCPIKLRHESEIREHWPEKVRARIRAEVLSHRPEGEDEVRRDDFLPTLVQLRWHEGIAQNRRVYDEVKWTNWKWGHGSDWENKAEEWFRRNVQLNDNQFHSVGFVFDLRWHNGTRQFQNPVTKYWHSVDGDKPLTSDPEQNARAEAWFEKNKPAPKLAENERLVAGKLYRFRVNGGQLEWQHFTLKACDPWVPVDSTDTKPPDVAAREWLDKQVPKPLASNQVLAEDETSPIELRWHEGAPEARYAGENGPWFTWKLGGVWCKAADTWFRANCPIDRFVTDDGRVLKFRMRDDGGAEAKHGSATIATVTADGEFGMIATIGDGALPALCAFHYAERAKWTFEWQTSGPRVYVHKGPPFAAYFNGEWVGLSGHDPIEKLPAYVRASASAEKMWRERETKEEWDTRWGAISKEVSIINLGGRYVAHFGVNGLIRFAGPEIPSHILTEARAKFRENYVLKPNEIWKRGEVVKLTWDARQKMVDGGNFAWKPAAKTDIWCTGQFIDEAERITAYNRCQEFYCENAEDAYLWKRGLLAFLMVGDIGHAKIGTSTVWTSDHPNSREYPEEEFRGREKLIRWTYKQLAARKGKAVMFECDSWTKCGSSRGPGHALELWKVPPGLELPAGNRFRITIEPAGES